MTIWSRFPDGFGRNQLRDKLLMRVGVETKWPDTIPLAARLTMVTVAAVFSYEHFKKFESFETELYRWELNGAAWALRCVPGYGNHGAFDYEWACNQLPLLAGYIDELPNVTFFTRAPSLANPTINPPIRNAVGCR